MSKREGKEECQESKEKEEEEDDGEGGMHYCWGREE